MACFPEKHRGWPEARAELIRQESRQVAQRVDAPFVQDREDVESSLARSAAHWDVCLVD